jgi:hypothetical protein
MNAEQIIAEIEWLEQLFRLPDKRQVNLSEWRKAKRLNEATYRQQQIFRLPDTRSPLNLDRTSATQKLDETYHDDPRFRLWRPDDV